MPSSDTGAPAAPGSGPKVRIGAVACIHRFGSSLTEHAHLHVCVIDGVFELDADLAVRFIEVEGLDADDAETVQAQVRRRILRAFTRRDRLEKEDRQELEQWDHGGGFSLDASVRIEALNRQGLESLLRNGARPPFAADRRVVIDAQRLIDHRPKPSRDGQLPIIRSPLERIGRIAALVPPLGQHRPRYDGILATEFAIASGAQRPRAASRGASA
jgi:hypothetical protein